MNNNRSITLKHSYSYGILGVDEQSLDDYLDGKIDIDDIGISFAEVKGRYQNREYFLTLCTSTSTENVIYDMKKKHGHCLTKLERRLLLLLFGITEPETFSLFCKSLGRILWGRENPIAEKNGAAIEKNFINVFERMNHGKIKRKKIIDEINKMTLLKAIVETPKGHKNNYIANKNEHDIEACVREFLEEMRLPPSTLTSEILCTVRKQKNTASHKYIVKHLVVPIRMKGYHTLTGMNWSLSSLSYMNVDKVTDEDFIYFTDVVDSDETVSAGFYSINNIRKLSSSNGYRNDGDIIFSENYSILRDILSAGISKWIKYKMKKQYETVNA